MTTCTSTLAAIRLEGVDVKLNNASTAMREKHTNKLRTRILYADGQRAEICVEQLEQITNELLFLVPTESYRKLWPWPPIILHFHLRYHFKTTMSGRESLPDPGRRSPGLIVV